MASPNSSARVVEVCRVAPPLPASPDHSLPLTFFDIRWLRFAPVQPLYFYEISSSNLNDSTSFSFDSILEKLKTSLSLTLQHFLPLAGNLTWPQDSLKPSLTYLKGDTLSLTIAESTADFDHLSSNYNLLEAQEHHPLIPQLKTSHERAAVMALQITLFPNKGFSIGAAIHHAVLDGLTSVSFFKSWAHICKHQGLYSSPLPDHLKPFYDRTVVEDKADELGTLFSNQYQDIDGPNNRSVKVWELQPPQDSIRGTFELTRASIQKLRAQVISTLSSDTILHLSTFSLACAYTWVSLVKSEETKEYETQLIFAADCRSRLDLPIPATYFGNCTVGCLAVAETKGLLGEDGLVLALTAITEAMKRLEQGVLNGAENWVARLSSLRRGRMVAIAGSHRFGVYETDFGFGKPNKVELVSIDRTGAIYISDTKNGGGGLDVGLVLKKRYMDAFASLFAKGL